MNFAWPQLLWVLPIPLTLLLIGLLRRQQARKAAHADRILRGEATAQGVRLGEQVAGSKGRPLTLLASMALICALARPQWGVTEEPVYTTSREVLVALDLSRSMLADDVKPTRLDRAKLLIQSLLDHLRGERTGLVVFSGTAFLQCPLSTDYEIFQDLLTELGPDYLPEGGTAYKALLEASLDAFGKTENADRYLIILSDGEALDEDWKELLPELNKRKVRVLGLGIGTREGAVVPDGKGGLIKDERGAVVLSRLENRTLAELAEATDGVHLEASSWIDLPALLEKTVETGRANETEERKKTRLVERYQWPLALALALGLLGLAKEFEGRIRARRIGLALRTVSLAALCSLFAQQHLEALQPAGTPAKETAPESAIIATTRELCTKPKLEAADCLRIAQDTLTWGTELKAKNQAVSTGPVRDAIEAVSLGKALEPQSGEWDRLRKELEALLAKAPEQKQDEQQQDQQKQDQQQKQQGQDDSQNKKPESKDGQQGGEQQQPEQQKKEEEGKQDPQQKQEPKEGEDPPKQKAFEEKEPQKPANPPRKEEMKQVGGQAAKAPENKEKPELVVPLEKLEKLKSQDSPGRLFELMKDERKAAPANTKNW